MSDTIDSDDLETQVRELTTQLPPLTVQIRESNERAVQARRLTIWHGAISLLVCILLICVGVVLKQQSDSANQIRDCVSPKGQCAQRNAQVLAITTDALAYRGELQRLKTELPISEAKGDQIRVDESNKRIAELQTQIDDTNKRIAAIRQQIKGAQ